MPCDVGNWVLVSSGRWWMLDDRLRARTTAEYPVMSTKAANDESFRHFVSFGAIEANQFHSQSSQDILRPAKAMAPSRTATKIEAKSIIIVVITTVGAVRVGGLMKFWVTPGGGFPAGVLVGSTPGGRSMLR